MGIIIIIIFNKNAKILGLEEQFTDESLTSPIECYISKNLRKSKNCKASRKASCVVKCMGKLDQQKRLIDK